jgi:hypothetical protein
MGKALVKIPDELVARRIFSIRGENVMLDSDLAQLYGVETKVLKQQVKRNIQSFPEDFMPACRTGRFELTSEEFEHLRSQIVTSRHGGARYMPMAFTEHGVLMLSSVLKSPRARAVNPGP